jgi:pilus assembly protein CpaC
VLTVEFDVTRIAVTDPAIADATVVAPREILVDGKGPGTVSLILWGGTRRSHYDVVVEPAITVLQQQLRQLFPAEDIQVLASEGSIVLSGQVSSNAIMLKAAEIAQSSSQKAAVINMLQLPGGMESQQVMLQVRIAEVNQRAFRELGASLFTSGAGLKTTWGRVTTQQFSAPDFESLEYTKDGNGDIVSQSGELVFGDFLNLFFLNAKYDIGLAIRALKGTGHFQTLAEPNLIAYNGQEASFLAGGEIPVPVVQGTTGSVTIQFRDFGIKLAFTPTIAGDVIRLKVAPEVSSLDFANGVTLGGFRVPALIVRKASTDVELRDGQSFAIAGLLDNSSQEDTSAVPLLSSLPIIGNFFKSKAERAARTELMVLVTPRLVKPLDPDEVPPLPTMPMKFIGGGEGVGKELEGGGGTVDAPPAKPVQKKPGGGLRQ